MLPDLKKKANTVSKTFGEYSPCPFSSCYFLHQDGWASVLYPSALAIEIVESLAENFKTKYSYFHS
jgi:hypothetical protein